jgi:hypothetical protein
LILVHQSPTTLLREYGNPPNLGVLSSPRRFYRNPFASGYRWAADNDAFLAWSEKRFLWMLEQIAEMPGCLFVASPDVVGDSIETLERFLVYAPRIRETGQPVALVAQDGIEDTEIPWDELAAIFIGGTSEFKMGPVAASVCREAKERGKWVHMGRVNSQQRIRYAKSIGCDSVDGGSFSTFRETKLLWGLDWAASPQQLGFVI